MRILKTTTDKKRIVILTMNPTAGYSYKSTLERIFGIDYFEILVYTPQSYPTDGHVPEVDLYLASMSAIKYAHNMTDFIPLGIPVVDIRVLFNKKSVDQVASIPDGTKAYLVNTNEPLALECIVEFYQQGVCNVLMTPLYTGAKINPDIKVAITPGESDLIPSSVEKVYNLGHRMLSPSTIVEMLYDLNLTHLLELDRFKEYSNLFNAVGRNDSMLLDETQRRQAGIDVLIESIDGGSIGINDDEKIFCCNKKALKMLQVENQDIIGKNYKEVLPFLDLDEYVLDQTKVQSFRKFSRYNNTDLTIDIKTIVYQKKFLGYFINIQSFMDMENKQHDARLSFMTRGYTAKYTFDDIAGKSQVMKDTCIMAKHMASTNATILINGESGTGKELLASAIHNASERANYPYVAINCAAIPENLLESELFGYEEGAFTGAKKKGKLGLFEHAHKGTIFLDEIGDMSPQLQVKLLRVLQEKEVMRIGGNRLINIDVRIIAATNVEIDKMVREGKMRKDLYYRLNTMQLTLPPLRERREDIPVLIDHIKRKLGCKYEIADDAMEAIMRHDFDGNVRELHNYVEFFQCLGKSVIQVSDLPERITGRKMVIERDDDDNDLQEEEKFVIKYLYERYKEGKTAGRRTICEKAVENGIFVTEQEVRGILKKLESMGLIKIKSGRGGSRLSDEGILLAERFQSI